MQIGELANLIGISTRAIRHYHHIGLLPEPRREPNGYRTYTVRDAVVLARIKRLGELGLSLDEIRDVIADDAGRDLREVLVELDDDLERQEREIRRRRSRLAELIRQPTLHPDDPVSAEMAAVLSRLPTAGGVAATERELLALMDVVTPEPMRREITGLLNAHAADPAVVAVIHELYAALDELADAPPADPRIPGLAKKLAAALPADLVELVNRQPAAETTTAGLDEQRWLDELLGELSPAQAEVVRQALDPAP